MPARYPQIMTVTGDPNSHTTALQTVAAKCDIYERNTVDIGSSFVRVQDLLDLGILKIVNGQLALGDAFSP